MNVRIFAVPYDSGHRAERMGRGPEHFIQHGLRAALESDGHAVTVETVEAPGGFRAEVGTAFALYRRLAERVAAARGAFPLILSGNCGAALGGIAGLDPADGLGIVWFDAHGDFHTPETTASGFFDGMGLSIAAGRCWTGIARSIPGFMPVPEASIVHVGGRDLDPGERTEFARSNVAVIEAAQIARGGLAAALAPALDAMRGRVRRVYVHLDLDVFDPGEARVNHFPAPPGGLSVNQIGEALDLIRRNFAIAGAGFASYDPAFDEDDRALRAGLRLARSLANGESA